MSTDTSFEQRLAAVESEVAALKSRVENNGAPANWIERFVDIFKEEPDIAELIEYGRQFREADRQQQNGKP